MSMLIQNKNKVGFSIYDDRVCIKCTKTFYGKKHEKFCPECEIERRKKSYIIKTDMVGGWHNLGGNCHIRFTPCKNQD